MERISLIKKQAELILEYENYVRFLENENIPFALRMERSKEFKQRIADIKIAIEWLML